MIHLLLVVDVLVTYVCLYLACLLVHTLHFGFMVYIQALTEITSLLSSHMFMVAAALSKLTIFSAILDGVISNGYQLVTSVTAAPKPVTDQTLINLQVSPGNRKH